MRSPAPSSVGDAPVERRVVGVHDDLDVAGAKRARRGGRTSAADERDPQRVGRQSRSTDDPHAGDAAVEQEVGAGRERRVVGEVDDRGRDLLARDHATERLPPAERLEAGVGIGVRGDQSARPTGSQTVPGETQLTRMPWAISSAAIARVSASTAPFDAE